MGGPHRRDLDVVMHLLMMLGLVAGDLFVLLFAVPELFDRHRTELDMLCGLLIVGTAAFSYLAGRYIWRSAYHCIDRGHE